MCIHACVCIHIYVRIYTSCLFVYPRISDICVVHVLYIYDLSRMYTISSPGRDFLSENFLGIAIIVMRQSVVRSPGAISKRTGKSLWPNLATCSSLSSSNLPRPLLASLLFLVPRAIPTSSLLIQWVAHDDVLHLRFRRSHSILRGERLATGFALSTTSSISSSSSSCIS